MPDDAALERIDVALMRLRRFVTAPPSVPHRGHHVEVSTVLVVDAVVRAGAATVGQVAGALDVAPSTASRLVTRAADAGMIRRRPSPDDPRTVELTPTRAGRALHAAARSHRHDLLRQLTDGWPDDDRRTFAALLDRFTSAMS